jgi:thiamine biosynthesis lipoprotein
MAPSATVEFRAMSCSARAVVVGDRASELAARIPLRVDTLERRWSRFLADSEVTGLNTAGGEPRRCSPDTVTLVEAMVQGWHATSGAFDPTLLGTLVELGYAASRDDATVRTSLAPGVLPQGQPSAIGVDRVTNVVRLPAGTTIDPGGVGKGLAADLVVAELLDDGAVGALVEIGGDLRVDGESPTSEGWAISVQPFPEAPTDLVHLTTGGVATSTSRLRTWTAATGAAHHLLDPRSLTSTSGEVVACSVIAGTAAWAEMFTKVAFVERLADALAIYDRLGLAALVTLADGRSVPTDPWKNFLR